MFCMFVFVFLCVFIRLRHKKFPALTFSADAKLHINLLKSEALFFLMLLKCLILICFTGRDQCSSGEHGGRWLEMAFLWHSEGIWLAGRPGRHPLHDRAGSCSCSRGKVSRTSVMSGWQLAACMSKEQNIEIVSQSVKFMGKRQTKQVLILLGTFDRCSGFILSTFWGFFSISPSNGFLT